MAWKGRFYGFSPLIYSDFLLEWLIFVHIYVLAAWLAVKEAVFDSGHRLTKIKTELTQARLWTWKTTKRRKILVVGGDGTIGNEIVNLLQLHGDFECHVVVHHTFSSQNSRWNNDKNVHVYSVDLVEKEQILLLADRLKSHDFEVGVFAAGIMLCPEYRTPDGVEMHNAVNVVGQLMLFEVLQTNIHRSVFLSSATAKTAWIPAANANFLGAYAGPYQAYASSKLNLAVYVKEMAKERLISSVSVHPGTVPGRLYRNANPLVRYLTATWLPFWMRKPEMAAALVLHTVFRDDLTPGAYYEDTDEIDIFRWIPHEDRHRIYNTIHRRIEMWMEH
ncbi:unnamed protein product [Caenorhabditis sp. 36 PRJEB53466]|nr:unnamed protein product [Caenorhabditis sp. 36 PRJEB53466]